MKNTIIGLSFIALTIFVGFTSFYLYKKNEVDSRITKLDGQIKNALALEDDIFSQCMDGKEQSPQNISVCESNTQQQISILTRDSVSEKQQLENLSISDILSY